MEPTNRLAPTAAIMIPSALVLAALCGCPGPREEEHVSDPPQPNATPATAPATRPAERGRRQEKATFAAGCFWGVEAAFRRVDGVLSARVGYTGGTFKDPTYRDVCSGTTGHAEAVEVIYDPDKVSYDDLLEVFWTCHDPTTLNRQGPDIGDQYRSAIFCHSPAQESAAKASRQKHQAAGRFQRPIVTQIVPAAPFCQAEEYHQRYLEKRGKTTCAPKP